MCCFIQCHLLQLFYSVGGYLLRTFLISFTVTVSSRKIFVDVLVWREMSFYPAGISIRFCLLWLDVISRSHIEHKQTQFCLLQSLQNLLINVSKENMLLPTLTFSRHQILKLNITYTSTIVILFFMATCNQ